MRTGVFCFLHCLFPEPRTALFPAPGPNYAPKDVLSGEKGWGDWLISKWEGQICLWKTDRATLWRILIASSMGDSFSCVEQIQSSCYVYNTISGVLGMSWWMGQGSCSHRLARGDKNKWTEKLYMHTHTKSMYVWRTLKGPSKTQQSK